ncbi:GNAT family N-acetyltransferase [Pseudoroseicyclus aestuarii]|uniref:L-amino acid N-acyltransferase YncA n=1 Tax=Pseudoroseicyclus aestuarii TaxID=1795041 RepID=A0A318SPA0_9RHOB|nr:GNAT family N-acetyltransferase [Pseudoroseicyclus aestuarii]PYE83700.1 L-amino acid N-acyltransferase YncA [Pseudoroseicyclus aestuarii]
MAPDPAALASAMAATWPPARAWSQGPVLLREGLGGGSRTSAATSHGPVAPDDIAAAEAAMRRMGQVPLFMIRASRPEDAALDDLLAQREYRTADPTVILAARVAGMAQEAGAACAWPPPAEAEALWLAGGIDAGRQAVMARAAGPKTVLLAPQEGRLAATGFVACAEGIAVLHALEVRRDCRRRGFGRAILAGAAGWARDRGAAWLAMAVTRANAGALALYRSAGLAEVGGYHYRRADA